MTTTMRLLPLLFAAILFFSACNNNKTYCWVCTTDTTYNAGGYMNQTVHTGKKSLCDKTHKEIRDVEANGARTFSENNINKSTITSCVKQ